MLANRQNNAERGSRNGQRDREQDRGLFDLVGRMQGREEDCSDEAEQDQAREEEPAPLVLPARLRVVGDLSADPAFHEMVAQPLDIESGPLRARLPDLLECAL